MPDSPNVILFASPYWRRIVAYLDRPAPTDGAQDSDQDIGTDEGDQQRPEIETGHARPAQQREEEATQQRATIPTIMSPMIP